MVVVPSTRYALRGFVDILISAMSAIVGGNQASRGHRPQTIMHPQTQFDCPPQQFKISRSAVFVAVSINRNASHLR